jgi:hypothetical protein
MVALEVDGLPRDETLDEELAREDDVHMSNLFEEDTGVPGVIFISTAMASHGPRVKFSFRAGRHQPSFSVALSDPPRVVANSLPQRDLNRAAPLVLEWAALNREALVRYWNEGDGYSRQETNTFVESLGRVQA